MGNSAPPSIGCQAQPRELLPIARSPTRFRARACRKRFLEFTLTSHFNRSKLGARRSEGVGTDPGSLASIDHRSLWSTLAIVALNGAVWTALTSWPRNARFAAFLTLPFFVYFSFANVLQHVYWSALFRTYAPGVTTAVLLVAPVVLGLPSRPSGTDSYRGGMQSRCTPRSYLQSS